MQILFLFVFSLLVDSNLRYTVHVERQILGSFGKQLEDAKEMLDADFEFYRKKYIDLKKTIEDNSNNPARRIHASIIDQVTVQYELLKNSVSDLKSRKTENKVGVELQFPMDDME